MARPYSTEEKDRLTAAHKELLEWVEEAIQYHKNCTDQISSIANAYTFFQELEKIMTQELQSGSSSIPLNSRIRDLMHAIYLKKAADPVSRKAKSIEETYVSRIREDLQAVNVGNNSMTWFLTSGAKKQKAIEAYQALQELLNSSYAEDAAWIHAETGKIRNTQRDSSWTDFENNRDAYLSIFMDAFAGHTAENPAIQDLLRDRNQILQEAENWDRKEETARAEIKKTVNNLLVRDAMKILREVPAEEISNIRPGTRVKTLKDHGYTTMADLYTATAYSLASIQGITETTAFSIKECAKTYADQIVQSSKIKLNADDRNPEATKVLSAIYQYQKMAEALRGYKDCRQQNRKVIHDDIDTLEQFATPNNWLFYADDFKQHLSGLYHASEAALAQLKAFQLPSASDFRSGFSETVWEDFRKNTVQYFNTLEDICPGILGNDDGLYGLPEDLAREIQEEQFFPAGLKCELRRYQEWGVKYILHQERVLLGDEMGLGKTVQAIAAMVSLRNVGDTHFMVVCPASVLPNWCKEVTAKSKLRVTKIHGSDKMGALRSWNRSGGVAVTTYETVKSFCDTGIEKLDLLVVDEAHYIKSAKAKRSISVRKLCDYTSRILFMTGTALENNVDEMVSLIEVLQPQIAGKVQDLTFMASAPQFREKIARVYYRRKREDVLTELPEKEEINEWCTMSGKEETVYEQSLQSKNQAEIRKLSWNMPNLEDSCKAVRVKEIVEEAEQNDRKVLIFSFFLETIRKLHFYLGERCIGPINGSVPVHTRQEMIDQFEKAPAGAVLLAQIQAGGTGLNIQAASVVIICEPQFKPSIENQAISRAYRMGQSRTVFVYRMLCEKSIDERMMKLLEQKQALFDAFADKSVAAKESLELDSKTFGNLIQEEIDRIREEKGIVSPKNENSGAEQEDKETETESSWSEPGDEFTENSRTEPKDDFAENAYETRKPSTFKARTLEDVKNRMIVQYDEAGNLIDTYDSVTEAARTIGVETWEIRRAANGYAESAGGYIWRYEFKNQNADR